MQPYLSKKLAEIYFTPTPKGLTLSQNSCIDCVVLQNLGFNIYTWKLNRVLFEYEFITNHGKKRKLPNSIDNLEPNLSFRRP